MDRREAEPNAFRGSRRSFRQHGERALAARGPAASIRRALLLVPQPPPRKLAARGPTASIPSATDPGGVASYDAKGAAAARAAGGASEVPRCTDWGRPRTVIVGKSQEVT